MELSSDILDSGIVKIKDNIVELASYDGRIDAFNVAPDLQLATTLVEDSTRLFNTDILKLDAVSFNPSLNLPTVDTSLFHIGSIINVNEGISSLINDPLSLSNSVSEIANINPTWESSFDPLTVDLAIGDFSDTIRMPDLNLFASEISTNALLAESTYLDLPKISDSIHTNFAIDAGEAVLNFSDSFSKFGSLIGLESGISSGFNIDKDILTISSKELVRTSLMLDEFAINDSFFLPHYDEKLLYVEHKDEEEDDDLKNMLLSIDNGLVKMLERAEKALRSSNPDKIRHFGTSLRELFTHVLHSLAPNDKVKKWTNNPDHYHNGRPTRRARLLYISRDYNNERFQDFLDADVKSVLAFIDLFQGLTHSIKSSFSEQQLKGMLIKMRGTLHFILTTNER